MSKQERMIKGLGEVVLRVNDLEIMKRFYEDVIGLELMSSDEHMVFFKIAEGYGGHTRVLALFDRSVNQHIRVVSSETSTLDHIAFEIALGDFQREKARLEQLGLQVATAEHAWVQWRSLFVTDPEGNTVEMVCYDPSIKKELDG